MSDLTNKHPDSLVFSEHIVFHIKTFVSVKCNAAQSHNIPCNTALQLLASNLESTVGDELTSRPAIAGLTDCVALPTSLLRL